MSLQPVCSQASTATQAQFSNRVTDGDRIDGVLVLEVDDSGWCSRLASLLLVSDDEAVITNRYNNTVLAHQLCTFCTTDSDATRAFS